MIKFNKNRLLAIWIKSIIPILLIIFLTGSCSKEDGPSNDGPPDKEEEGSVSPTDIKVWVANPWQSVLRSTRPDSKSKEAVNVKAASNEYEAFRIIISNMVEDELENITFQVSNLKGDNDRVISSSNVRLFSAYYHNITSSSPHQNSEIGWYPDALIPFIGQASTNKLNIAKEQNAEVWCDLFVPKGTSPGDYKGTVTLWSGSKELASVPVNLEVWDFELPSKISMRSDFGYFTAWEAKFTMGVEGQGYQDLLRLHSKELLDHRAVPSTPVTAWPEWNETDGVIDNGESKVFKNMVEGDKVNTLRIPTLYQDQPEKWKAYLKDIANWLRKLGYLEMAYVYIQDEPNSASDYQLARDQAALIHSADPEIKTLCTEQTHPTDGTWGNLFGAVDIWVPIFDNFDNTYARPRMDLGEELWVYTALVQGDVPHWQIDSSPLNYRSPTWISNKFNITGFLYWSTTAYALEEKSMQQVWEYPSTYNGHWGEGILLYPGEHVGRRGFLPSIRIKRYRESMEDYEYFKLAEKRGQGAGVNNIVNNVVTDFHNWSNKADDYEKAREQIARLIMGK